MSRQYGHARGADLVRRIAVCRDPVAAHEYGVHPAVFHHGGRHIVADQRHVHPGGKKLIGGQPGSLQKGPGLIRIYMKAVSTLLSQIDGRGGGSVTDGGELSRVAVGQNTVALLHKRQSIFPDPSAYPDVLVPDLLRLLLQKRDDLCCRASGMLRHHPFHPVQRPGKIHRCRPGRVQIFLILSEFCKKSVIIFLLAGFCKKIDAKGRTYPDGRSPADLQQINGIPDLLRRFQPDQLRSAGKQGLIDDHNRVPGIIQTDRIIIHYRFLLFQSCFLDPVFYSSLSDGAADVTAAAALAL